ncbi:MAG: hypothetical protein ACYSU7_10085 [Planctomycetota bacterium]|jgi:hypothetical protein
MKSTSCYGALGLLLVLTGGGCQSPPTGAGSGRISSNLVISGAGWGTSEAEGGSWHIDPGAWEFGRNDERLNAGPAPVRRWHEWAEIRNRNQTRTSNGRPRDYSNTFIRTYSLRQVN